MASRFPETWLTTEKEPRLLTVKGVSLIDPDCLVAYEQGSRRALWIVEPSGFVCGLDCRAVRLSEPSHE